MTQKAAARKAGTRRKKSSPTQKAAARGNGSAKAQPKLAKKRTSARPKKNVYSFGEGKADAGRDDKNLLGGKGANLAEMCNLGLPVPPGFTISTEVCTHFVANGGKYPAGLEDELAKALRKVEKAMGRKFGDEKDPLLVSVRSGARVSMPGMMDTVLNLGLNDRDRRGALADPHRQPALRQRQPTAASSRCSATWCSASDQGSTSRTPSAWRSTA